MIKIVKMQSKKKITQGRPSDQRNAIVNYLRDKIVSGTWQPGIQLPTRTEIEGRFGAGPMTVQRALNHLAEDGFVTSRGSRGTFVTEQPPHLFRVGLVFASPPTEWTRNWLALDEEAKKSAATSKERSFAFYYGVDGHSDSEDYLRLLRDLENRRIAGLIFSSLPFDLRNTPVLEMADLPRVAWGSISKMGMPAIDMDKKQWLQRALEYLNSRGRKRVAVIMPPTDDRENEWAKPIFKAGFETHLHWLQSVYLRDHVNARYLVQLLMRCEEKPDALLIADDNLVERTTAGLVEAGIRVPQDLEVVAHCNYPWQPESLLPVKFLGFDARQGLAMSLESLDRQRQNQVMPPMTLVPALFEDEVVA